MLKDFLFRKIFRISIGVVGIFILTENAFAGSTKYKNTKQPYWGVGQYNSALSDACRRHEFNQKKVQNLNIGYSGNIINLLEGNSIRPGCPDDPIFCSLGGHRFARLGDREITLLFRHLGSRDTFHNDYGLIPSYRFLRIFQMLPGFGPS